MHKDCCPRIHCCISLDVSTIHAPLRPPGFFETIPLMVASQAIPAAALNGYGGLSVSQSYIAHASVGRTTAVQLSHTFVFPPSA